MIETSDFAHAVHIKIKILFWPIGSSNQSYNSRLQNATFFKAVAINIFVLENYRNQTCTEKA